MSSDVTGDPSDLFAHVYAQPTAALTAQRKFLLAELGQDGSPR
jgi:hypothetical protein